MPSYLLRTQRPSDKDHKIQGVSIPQTLREKPRRSFLQQKPVPPTIEKKPNSTQKNTYCMCRWHRVKYTRVGYLLPMSGWMAAATADMK